METVNRIKPTTPYMLRNDGVLFACGTVHPYIKMYYTGTFEQNLNELFNVNPHFLDWFAEHTQYEDTRNLIENLRSNKDEETFNKLNNATNQEFCRVRSSNFKYKYGGDNGQLYFRLSSRGFNWYDAIWKVVSDNASWVKYVTVMRDYQTFGKQFDYLKLKGQPVNEIPVDDFLTVSGNPVLEKIVKQGPKWQVQSEKGRNMGTYDTKGEAEKRLQQVEYFKHLDEGENMENRNVEKIDSFIDSLYDLRQQSIANEGEYGTGNLIFKELRNKGYLDNLKDLKTELENKELSLEGLDESLTEADDEPKEMSLEDKLELCFTEKGCNYHYSKGMFTFDDEESFDKAYDAVQVLAADSAVDVENMTIAIKGEQTTPDIVSGSAPTSDYDAYLPEEDDEADEEEEVVEESLNESVEDEDKYYKVNIYCHPYFHNGVIEEDVELYASSEEDAKKQAIRYVKQEYGYDFYKKATEYEPLKIEITYCGDDESLNEANQDPLQSSIYKKEANKQKKNPNHYMPRGGLNKGLGDPAQSIKAFNHMMGADNFSGGASMADGTVGAVSVGGGMGEAMDPNKQKEIPSDTELEEFVKNQAKNSKAEDIVDAFIDAYDLDLDAQEEKLLYAKVQKIMGNTANTNSNSQSDLDRILNNNQIGKLKNDRGLFLIDATELASKQLVTIYWKDANDDIYRAEAHNYYGKTDVLKEFIKSYIDSLDELIEPHKDTLPFQYDIAMTDDEEDDIEIAVSKE